MEGDRIAIEYSRDGLSQLTSREASILAISLATVGISLGLLALSNTPTIGNLLRGYYSAWFGLAFREMSILQTSFEDLMKRDRRKARGLGTIRFVRPLGIRIAQMGPMILWIKLAQPIFLPSVPIFPVIAGVVLIILAIVLNILEYFFLWID